jgi:hypothetical protein
MIKIYFKIYHFLLLGIIATVVSNSNAQPFNGFISFDGIDDQLTVSGSPIPYHSDFTIEFWFKPCQDSVNPTQVILGNSDNMQINFFTMFTGKNAYQLCARYNSVDHVCHQDQQFYYDSLWHHIAVTYQYSLDRFDIFYDGIGGTLSTNYAYNFSPYPSMTVGVGTYQTFFYKHFNGYMDELRISNIIRYVNAYTPPLNQFSPDINTIGLWHFEENNPLTSVIDYSGRGLHFTPSGNPQMIHLSNMITLTGNVLTVTEPFASYQWVDCLNNNAPIPGETNQSFTINTIGSYAVEVTNTNCTLTSDCFVVNTLGLNKAQDNLGISIFQNAAHDVLTIDKGDNPEIDIQLFESNGKSVFFKTTGQLITSIDMAGFAGGIYFLKVSNKENFIAKKIVKN